MIFAGRSARGGWSRAQLTMLGVEWPPMKGWLARLDGTEIEPYRYRAFVLARNRRELKQCHKRPGEHPDLFGTELESPEQTEHCDQD